MESSDNSKIILDISAPSTSSENIAMDEDIFSANEEDQALVNKFLEGEMNFNDYIENVAGPTLPEDTEMYDIKPLVESIKKNESVNKAKKGMRKLPPALKGLMGEANLRVARGDKETAVKICLEIIRQVPTAAEPFLTLAGIYDEMGDEEKFLQMSLVAAHLSSTDAYQWVHLAELSEKQNLIKQAITCYTKAINLDIQDMELHQRRATLLESLGDKKTAIRGYIRLLCSLKPEQGELIISLAKTIAQLCHKENDLQKASYVLEIAIQKCPQLINLEIINLQLELLLQMKNYKSCLDIMLAFCNLVVKTESDGDDIKIINFEIPSETPIDIMTKMIIVMIHMKATHLIDTLMEPIMNLEPSTAGDLYLDIVDAFVENKLYENAHKLLHTLIQSEEYCLPGVWLKYAENLKNLKKFQEATTAYYKVLENVPQHVEVRMTLASLLVELGRPDEAINALTQNEEYDYLDVGLLYEKCTLLRRDPSRAQELIMVSQVLFSRHCTQIRNKDELSTISTLQRYDRKRVAVKQVRKSKKESEADSDIPTFRTDKKGPTIEEEWELFKYICSLCIEHKMYITLQRLTFTVQLSTIFHVYKFDIDVLSVIAAYLNRDSHNGYNIIRTLVAKKCLSVKLWHLFNLIITKSDDARHNRFIMRQLSRDCEHPALGILHGNNCLVSGTYKYAMHEYSTSYSKNPTPLSALLLGLTYLQMAAQKFTSKKHHLVLQALGLLAQYKDKRSPQGLQEVHYNLARGFHHLGLYTSAIFHYKKVFEYRDLILPSQKPEVFDLSREAAFNLHLIYSQSESFNIARMFLDKYIVI